MAEPKKKMDRRSRRKMMEICRRLKEKTKRCVKSRKRKVESYAQGTIREG